MPRPRPKQVFHKSRAFTLCEQTLRRSSRMMMMSEVFLKIQGRFTAEQRAMYEPVADDVGRASVVIAVAAMDAYFTRKFTEVMVPFLKKNGPTPHLTEVLKKAGLDTEQALQLIAMQRPYRRIRTLVEAYLDRYVTQKFSAIDSLFVCFAMKNFSENVRRRTKRKNLLKSVGILIDRRHCIVHEGDVDSRGKLIPVAHLQLKKRILDLAAFVFYSEELISRKMERLKRKQRLGRATNSRIADL